MSILSLCEVASQATLLNRWLVMLWYFYLWPFRLKGYCHCLRLSVHPSVCPSVNFYLFCTKTCHRFELESSNLHQTCIMGYSQWVLITGVIDLDLHFKVILAILIQNSRKLVCLHSNSSQIWARITKFAPNIHPGYWKRELLTLTFKVILAILTWNSRKIWLFHAITCNGFELESPN